MKSLYLSISLLSLTLFTPIAAAADTDYSLTFATQDVPGIGLCCTVSINALNCTGIIDGCLGGAKRVAADGSATSNLCTAIQGSHYFPIKPKDPQKAGTCDKLRLQVNLASNAGVGKPASECGGGRCWYPSCPVLSVLEYDGQNFGERIHCTTDAASDGSVCDQGSHKTQQCDNVAYALVRRASKRDSNLESKRKSKNAKRRFA